VDYNWYNEGFLQDTYPQVFRACLDAAFASTQDVIVSVEDLGDTVAGMNPIVKGGPGCLARKGLFDEFTRRSIANSNKPMLWAMVQIPQVLDDELISLYVGLCCFRSVDF